MQKGLSTVWNFIKSYYQLFAPFIIAALFAIVAISSIPGMAATTDEKFHYTRGIMLLKTGDYRINQHHPILFNVIGALPGLFIEDLKIPDLDSDLWTYANKDGLSSELQRLNGGLEGFTENILYPSRVLVSLISSAFIIVFYFLIKNRFGFTIALISTLLLATSPTFLAHGRLVTTDVPAMMTILLTAIAGYDYFRAKDTTKTFNLLGKSFKVSERSIKFAVLIFAYFIALITKYTAVSLVAVIMAAIVWDQYLRKLSWGEFIKSSLIKIAILGFSLVFLITAAYKFQFATLKEMQYNNETKITYAYNDINGIRTQFNQPKIADTIQFVYEKVQLPFPQFFHGFYENVINHSIFGHKAFFLGDRSLKGWFWYFPVSFVLKEQLATVILFGGSLLLSIYAGAKYLYSQKKQLLKILHSIKPEYVIIVGIPLLMTVINLKSSLNLGVRYILPLFPFFYILIAAVLSVIYERYQKQTIALVAIVTVLNMASIISNFPYYIPYFNESIYPRNDRHLYLRDSSLDWKQNELLAKKYVAEHENVYSTLVDTPDGGQLLIAVRNLWGNPANYKEINYWLLSEYSKGENVKEIKWIGYTHVLLEIKENPYYKANVEVDETDEAAE